MINIEMEQVAVNVIRAICIMLLGVQCTYGQKYFVLDNTSSQYVSKSYVLNTKQLYNINAEISLFNILLTEHNRDKGSTEQGTLILFSVLPELIGEGNWNEINLDTIQNQIISIGKLRTLSEQTLFQIFDFKYGDETKYWNDYKLIIKRGEKYFVAKNCLLQFFAIRNRPDIFTNPYGTINVLQKPITVSEFRSIFNNTSPYSKFPLNIPPDDVGFDRRRDRREYLSKEIKIKDMDRFFQFWTYTDWGQAIHRSTDPLRRGVFAYERGIDRFVYHPVYLIIGGSFDFYFHYFRNEIGLTSAQLQENMIGEKIILADEFK